MPVLGIPLDELFARFGATIEPAELEHQLHRFGCSVEGWATAYRWRCPSCGTLSEGGEDAAPPPACEGCGADLRSAATPGAPAGQVQVLRMELLAVRPDLFGPEGLARGLRGFLRRESGAPRYRVEPGSFTVDVDPALAGPGVHRPRIVAAIVRGLTLDDARLRGLMKLQENVHWALGRDRKLASIGVYDLATVAGPALSYRAVELDGLRFVPLGFDPAQPHSALTPREILAKHPKGTAYAWLLEGNTKAPLLADAKGGVLSMPPIINSEATRVTTATKEVVIDVTGLADRHIDKALAMVVTSLLEACPEAHAETVTVRYADETRVTPDLAPHEVVLDPAAAGRLIGVPWTAEEVAELLRFMRHDAAVVDGQVRVLVPAWRSDILHPRDLVEDAAIAHGYDRIPAIGLAAATIGLPQPREEAAVRARAALAGLGFLEVMTLALTSEEATYRKTGLPDDDRQATIENPISVEQTMVRVSVLPGLLETLAINLGHSYPQRIAEVGLVVHADPAEETGASETMVTGFALAGDGLGYADARSALDALLRETGRDAGGVRYRALDWPLFIPGRGAEVLDGEGERIGVVGEVHPEVLTRFRIIHPVAVAEISL